MRQRGKLMKQKETEFRPVGDDEHSAKQQEKERQCRPVQFQDRAFEAIAGDEQVQADGWGEVAELHVGQEQDAEVHGVDAVAHGNRNQQRHQDNQCRKDVQHHADAEEKQVKQGEERPAAVDMFADGLEQSRGQFDIDNIVGRGQ